jgi:hypothetical protein
MPSMPWMAPEVILVIDDLRMVARASVQELWVVRAHALDLLCELTPVRRLCH